MRSRIEDGRSWRATSPLYRREASHEVWRQRRHRLRVETPRRGRPVCTTVRRAASWSGTEELAAYSGGSSGNRSPRKDRLGCTGTLTGTHSHNGGAACSRAKQPPKTPADASRHHALQRRLFGKAKAELEQAEAVAEQARAEVAKAQANAALAMKRLQDARDRLKAAEKAFKDASAETATGARCRPEGEGRRGGHHSRPHHDRGGEGDPCEDHR